MVLPWCEQHYNGHTFTCYHEDVHIDAIVENEWEKDFMQADNQTLFDLLVISHYLDLRRLFKIVLRKSRDMIQERPREEIQKTLHDSMAEYNRILEESERKDPDDDDALITMPVSTWYASLYAHMFT